MSIGPWFKCYPTDWLEGIRDLSLPAQGAYAHLIMRMYEAADAIYVDDKRIGKWLNSNARGWLKVKQELIDEGKLVELPDGGLINPRCLRQMVEECKSDRKIPDFICERIGKLSDMFAESFPKHLDMFSETSPKKPTKTKPPIRVQNPESEEDCTSVQSSARDPFPVDLIFKSAGGVVPPHITDFHWLTQLVDPDDPNGCDLHADILPTVETLSNRKKGENPNATIGTYKFFRSACLEARDRRVAGIPAVQPVRSPSGQVAGSVDDLTQHILAKKQQRRADELGDFADGRRGGDVIDAEGYVDASGRRGYRASAR